MYVLLLSVTAGSLLYQPGRAGRLASRVLLPELRGLSGPQGKILHWRTKVMAHLVAGECAAMIHSGYTIHTCRFMTDIL